MAELSKGFKVTYEHDNRVYNNLVKDYGARNHGVMVMAAQREPEYNTHLDAWKIEVGAGVLFVNHSTLLSISWEPILE